MVVMAWSIVMVLKCDEGIEGDPMCESMFDSGEVMHIRLFYAL